MNLSRLMPPRGLTLLTVLATSFAAVAAAPATWIDFNKNGKQDVYEDAAQPIERRIDDLLAQMNVAEKTCQLATLYGYGRVLKDPLPTPEWKNAIWKDGLANIDEMHNGIGKFAKSPYNETPAATVIALNTIQRWFIEQTRLGIPVDFTNEGVRGLNYVRSTNFPANIALGATWDRELTTRIGAVIAAEARAIGYTSIYAPLLDLARDPRWGRVVETYGEDPYHVAELCIRMARALQDGGVTSSPKHFAVYSEPKGGRDGAARTDPHVAPREMEMLHLRPWERIVKEVGIRGLMSSYNDYDGVPISGSREFLIDRLRTQWGFKGYVVSDSEAVEFLQTKHHVVATYPEAAAMFIREGGNVRTHFTPPDVFINGLRAELANGRLALSVVDARVRDVLRVKFATGIFDRPYVAEPEKAASLIRTPASQALALEAAHKSLVLLKNANNTLPLSPTLKRLLVCGPTAQMTETSFDRYGSNGGTVITALDGIRTRLAKTGTEVLFAEGCKVTDARWPESELFPEAPDAKEAALLADAVAQAKTADAVVVFLGDNNATIGESKSRTSLDLPGHHNALVRALLATGRPIVAVLLTGRPATINYLQRHVPAILSAWFPGEACGTAIADVLFGDFNPGGKLPVTFPRSVGQLPYNFPFKPGSHAIQGRKDDPNGFGQASIEGALYPFGFGLSYTTFAYSDLTVTPAIAQDGVVTVTCKLTNTGTRAGDEVSQLYFRQSVTSVTTYELSLVGFERVSLAPGESKTVTFKLPARDLELINREGRRVVEPGEFVVHVGASSADLRLHGKFDVRVL
jgi:beta-glucosidase